MLRDYFHKPAVLRLILCCHAIRATPNESNCLEYYARARKALIRADLLTPSTDLIISCQYIFLLARDYNQPALGQHFLQIAARMVKELALDVDPDDSPDSLVKLMIPRKKEERRRIFWSFYEVLTSNAAVSPSYTKLDISGDSVKAPSQVLDPHSVFRSDNVVHHTANIFNLIASIKQAWAATPLSISDVFNMITDSCLRDQFDIVITSIPQQYLLLSETLFSDINIEGHDIFNKSKPPTHM
ncbi:hypothetical protein BCR33DRAFT_371332 [Rhizoclosmatium globosum]|uniref:Transcription factor domain-containing protein n=1 Tax=Rhizoclosmatium globosum TaxID=329046 RepID=A0A1Y2BZH9_9FUNG|nr:hypothetical protein BCR33DRAFT_371332 [Rhizoclosmatium globosum]|eukprot:ORY40171.1 hypothetical protein BCR33DRAFT_371332 [Rhizoclosmatium globosum]